MGILACYEKESWNLLLNSKKLQSSSSCTIDVRCVKAFKYSTKNEFD